MTKDEQRAAQEAARRYPGPYLYLSPAMREQFIAAGYPAYMIREAQLMVRTDGRRD